MPYTLLSSVTTGGQTMPYSLLSHTIATGIYFTALMEVTSSYTWASSPLSKPSSWAQTHHLGESERGRNNASPPLQQELSPLWRINSKPSGFRSKVQIYVPSSVSSFFSLLAHQEPCVTTRYCRIPSCASTSFYFFLPPCLKHQHSQIPRTLGHQQLPFLTCSVSFETQILPHVWKLLCALISCKSEFSSGFLAHCHRGKMFAHSFSNDGWLFMSTSADLSYFSNSLSKSCNVSNDRDNLQRTKSREEIKMHWVSRPEKSDSILRILRIPLSISTSLACQRVESVPGSDKQIRGLLSQGKQWAGRVRKRESNAGRGGALLEIHTWPFSSNTSWALDLATEPGAATVSQPAEAWAPTGNRDALWNKLCTRTLVLFA